VPSPLWWYRDQHYGVERRQGYCVWHRIRHDAGVERYRSGVGPILWHNIRLSRHISAGELWRHRERRHRICRWQPERVCGRRRHRQPRRVPRRFRTCERRPDDRDNRCQLWQSVGLFRRSGDLSHDQQRRQPDRLVRWRDERSHGQQRRRQQRRVRWGSERNHGQQRRWRIHLRGRLGDLNHGQRRRLPGRFRGEWRAQAPCSAVVWKPYCRAGR
jgi:hypothetical protein